MRKANVAIIGCGYWGEKIIETCLKIDAIATIKLFDISSIRKLAIQQQYPNIHFYDTLKEIQQDKSITAVIVATELRHHYEISKQLLLAQKPVLCEKPLAATSQQCRELGEIAETTATTLMVGHTYLYNQSILQIKDILEQKSIGAIKQLVLQRCNFGPVRTDTDVVYDLATHDIAIANFLMNTLPVNVSAIGHSIFGEAQIDSCNIHLVYPNNTSADIFVSWAEPVKSRLVKIIGTHGAVYFDDMKTDHKITLYQYESSLSNDIDNNEKEKTMKTNTYASSTPPLYNEIIHFLNCSIDNSTPRSNWENGYEVVRIIEAIEKSIAQDGRITEV